MKDAAFQISVRPGAAEGEDWTADDLADLAERCFGPSSTGKQLDKSSGPCEMGTYGSTLYAGGDPPYVQGWVLSDGTHLIIVTLVDQGSLTEDEVVDVIDTVLGISLG
jgi:hypothetical protein